MIFIPREGEELPSIEEKKDKIILKTKQITTKVYQVTSATAKNLAEYEPILNAALAAKAEGDSVFQSLDWVKKKMCAIIITENLERVLTGLPGGTGAFQVTEVAGQPYALTSQYVTDRFEFEGLADIVAGCAKNDDLVYLCFDWEAKKNSMLFSTKDPADRQKCLMAADVLLEAA